MSEHAAHGHEHPAVAHQFSDAEWAEFQKDDIAAGRSVILLVSSIFSIGLILYTVVAIVTGS